MKLSNYPPGCSGPPEDPLESFYAFVGDSGYSPDEVRLIWDLGVAALEAARDCHLKTAEEWADAACREEEQRQERAHGGG